MFGSEEGRHRAHLGLPEREKEVAVEGLDALAQQGVRHRRHRVSRLAQRRQIPRRDRGILDERAPHHRQREDPGDLLALDELEQRCRVESAQQILRRAHHHRGRAESVELRGVEQRHEAGDAIVGRDPGFRSGHQRLEVDRGVAADHALRERGRPARVEIADRVAVADHHLGFGRIVGVHLVEAQPGAIGQRLFVLAVGAVRDDDVGDGRDLLDRWCHKRDQLCFDHDPACLRVIEDVGDLVGAPAEVHRHAHHAELRAREVRDQELRTVPRRQRQHVTTHVPPRGEAVRHAVHPRVELGVGPASIAVDHGDLVGQPGGGAGERVADVDPGDQVSRELEVHAGRLPLRGVERKCAPTVMTWSSLVLAWGTSSS